jgi:hypothetical protein
MAFHRLDIVPFLLNRCFVAMSVEIDAMSKLQAKCIFSSGYSERDPKHVDKVKRDELIEVRE